MVQNLSVLKWESHSILICESSCSGFHSHVKSISSGSFVIQSNKSRTHHHTKKISEIWTLFCKNLWWKSKCLSNEKFNIITKILISNTHQFYKIPLFFQYFQITKKLTLHENQFFVYMIYTRKVLLPPIQALVHFPLAQSFHLLIILTLNLRIWNYPL